MDKLLNTYIINKYNLNCENLKVSTYEDIIEYAIGKKPSKEIEDDFDAVKNGEIDLDTVEVVSDAKTNA